MATKESKRVMELRKKNYDQLSILVPKGCKELLKIMAIAEKKNVSDIVRNSIIEYARLRQYPSTEIMDKLLQKVSDEITPKEAKAILEFLKKHYS